MRRIKNTLASIALTGVLILNGNCGYSGKDFEKNKAVVLQEIKKTSPFNQNPVVIALPNHAKEKEWYSDFPFVSLNSEDIIYEKWNNFYLAKNKNKKNSKKIASKVNLIEKYLFALGINDPNNPDLYWIDKNWLGYECNLRKLRNDKGVFVDEGVVFSFKKNFNYLPKNLELGDINSDGFVDIVYEGNVNIGKIRKNAIKAIIGSEDGLKEDITLYYLGDEELGGLIARDVDNDKDSDLIFKLKRDDKNLFGLENMINKGNNVYVFKNGFRDKVENSDFLMHFLIMVLLWSF